MLIDLDSLKEINDTRGHDVGDRVLRDTADRMRSALRAGDVLARLAATSSALLVDTSEGQALAAVARLREMTPPIGRFSASTRRSTRSAG